MIPMTLGELAGVVGGSVAGDVAGAADVVVSGPAFIDSREVEPAGLFVAFDGEHADGHDYAAAAVSAGAAAVLARRPVGAPAVLVDHPQQALSVLATHVLSRLDVTTIALTGSQGKTSTKDLLAVVLAEAAETVATRGSFNNEIGLPLTVLRAQESTRFLVLEMGARGIGHVADLCRIAPPEVSLVLNVGKAHLGEFGTQEAIARAKGEIVEALTDRGTAVLNRDDPLVWAMRERTPGRVVSFGRSAPSGTAADVRMDDVTIGPDGCPSFTLSTGDQRADVRLRLLGEHQAANAAAAAAVAVAVGLPLSDVARSLAGVESLSRWRMERHERADGLVVVNDAYNANPDSMAAALSALVAIARGRGARPVAVLGEMRELGESSEDEHLAVGRLAARLGVTQVVAVGGNARAVATGASAQGAAQGEEPVMVEDNAAAVDWLRSHVGGGDVVLVKASRGARLDEVADALLAAEQDGDAR